MPNKDPASSLRQKAEEIARSNATQSLQDQEALLPTEMRRTFHELQVHQIELEMQNEELRRAQEELDAARARYFDLYDLAPVGYCTLSEKGLILEANLTAATRLGVTRYDLVKQPISRFIFKDDQDIWQRRREDLFETGEPQACELRMVKMDGTVFWAHWEATPARDADGVYFCRVALSDITERKRMEAALKQEHDELEQRVAERTEELLEANAALRTEITERLALEREVLQVSEREQHRIGEDLHDGLGQELTAIELLCSSLKNDLPADRPELRDQVARMGQHLREAIRQTRLLAHGLMGFRLTSHGLSAALAELARNITSLGRMQSRFDCPVPVSCHDAAIAGHLYRIAQEAVHNAVKHAQASQVTIHLAEQAEALLLSVSDNGQGLPHPDAWNRGMGLQVMRHRANAIGAKLSVESKPGQGVTVTCAWRRNESEASAPAGARPS